MIRPERLCVQVRMLATDAELCRIFEVTPEELEAHRQTIDRIRAETSAVMRHRRAQVQMAKPPKRPE